jgi:hypothetical protein
MIVIVSAAALLLLAAPQVAERGKSSVATLTATGAHDEGSVRVIDAVADIDSDNDSVSDLYELRVSCSGTHIASAVLTRRDPLAGHSSRDPASGLAAGRRVHDPFVVGGQMDGTSNTDIWAKTMKGRPVASWDLATAKGARTVAPVISPSRVDPSVCATR